MLFRLSILVGSVILAVAGVSSQSGEAKQSAIVKCSTRQMTAMPVSGVLASDGQRVYAGTGDGTLSAFDTIALEVLWKAELGGEFSSGIAMTETGVIVVTNSTGEGDRATEGSTIRLLSNEAGITVWSAKIPYSPAYSLGRINGSVAVVSSEGQVFLIDRTTGRIIWQTGRLGKISTKPSFSLSSIVIATSDKNVTVISAKDGTILAKQSSEFASTAVSFLKNDGLAVGDERGNLALFGSHEVKRVWRFKSGAAVSYIGETEAGLLVTSLDNFVYLISAYNGDVIWKKRLTGRLVEGGLALKSHFVALINGENSGYVLDLQKGRITDVITFGDADLANLTPIPVRDDSFVITTQFSLDLYSLAGCPVK